MFSLFLRVSICENREVIYVCSLACWSCRLVMLEDEAGVVFFYSELEEVPGVLLLAAL